MTELELKEELRQIPPAKRNRAIIEVFFTHGFIAALEVTQLFREIEREEKLNAKKCVLCGKPTNCVVPELGGGFVSMCINCYK